MASQMRSERRDRGEVVEERKKWITLSEADGEGFPPEPPKRVREWRRGVSRGWAEGEIPGRMAAAAINPDRYEASELEMVFKHANIRARVQGRATRRCQGAGDLLGFHGSHKSG